MVKVGGKRDASGSFWRSAFYMVDAERCPTVWRSLHMSFAEDDQADVVRAFCESTEGMTNRCLLPNRDLP